MLYRSVPSDAPQPHGRPPPAMQSHGSGQGCHSDDDRKEKQKNRMCFAVLV